MAKLDRIKINGKYLKNMLGIFELTEVEEKIEHDPLHSINLNKLVSALPRHYLIITYRSGNIKIKSREIPVRGMYIDFFNGNIDYNVQVSLKNYLAESMEII